MPGIFFDATGLKKPATRTREEIHKQWLFEMNGMPPMAACPAQTPGPESYGSTGLDFSSPAWKDRIAAAFGSLKQRRQVPRTMQDA